jgi:glycosyltransferase involved in cell wall biosynthesis
VTGIRWLSVRPGLGYGDASEAYLSGLRAAGIPITWTPLGWPSNSRPYGFVTDADLGGVTHRDIANLAIEHDTVVVCSPPLWHRQLSVEAAGRLLVAYTTWETDRLPAGRVTVLNRYDRVLVPSRFNAAVFDASGVIAPIFVVPHIARPARPTDIKPQPATGATFVFYLLAAWSTRKAILDTVAAFAAAFTDRDDVVLVIHTTPEDKIAAARPARGGQPAGQHDHATWFTLANALAGRRRLPKITLSTRWLTRAGVDALHLRGDCFVSLSRGEGWGLGAFDAAAHGNPVVVTGWGGTLEYLPSDYPYLVEYELVPTITEEPDVWWQPQPGEHWAKARIAHAASLLRHVFEHRDEARSWGGALKSSVSTKFAAARVTGGLIDALDARPDLLPRTER